MEGRREGRAGVKGKLDFYLTSIKIGCPLTQNILIARNNSIHIDTLVAETTEHETAYQAGSASKFTSEVHCE